MNPTTRCFAALLLCAAVSGCSSPSAPTDTRIPREAAARAFREAEGLCQSEGGALWGKSLCGPMMFADRETRQAVLNGPAPGATPDGPLFRLDLPAEMGLANTSTELGGQRWTMILWPLPEDETSRRILMMHESYHRIQPDLGLEGSGGLGTNAHLDTRDGRVWLRAEFHALAQALGSNRDGRRAALSDALLLRAYRQSLWPEAAAQERGLELNEGLADSTGVDAALGDPGLRTKAALGDLAANESAPSFVRSFAYATGPAYGQLLNAVDPAWRRGVHPDFDFAAAAAAAYKLPVPVPSKTSAEAALARHGGVEILAQEEARQKTLDERNARFTRLFLQGPTVHLRLEKMSITFNPQEVAGFEGHGSVYGTLEISDLWGTLKVDSGAALVSKDFREVYVPVSADTSPQHVAGQGWTLTLAAGYALAPDPSRAGSFEVRRQ